MAQELDPNDPTTWQLAKPDIWNGLTPMAPAKTSPTPTPSVPRGTSTPPVAGPPLEVPKGPPLEVPDDEDASGNSPEEKAIDSHPGHTSLPDWVKGQESQVDKYGPDQEKAVMDNIFKSQGSLRNNLAKGGAGLADAIMQGVARAGNPGFLANIESREQANNKMAADVVPTLQKMNAENMGEKQRLEGMTSASPLGASESAAIMPLLKTVYPGLSPDQYMKMAQNPMAVEKALGPASEIFKAKGQLAYEQGAREDAKVGQIAGRYNKPINDAQKSIDDLDSSIKGLKSGDLGQIASAQAIVSQALKLSPRLAHEAGGQSYAAKLDQWASGKFGNQSIPPELMKPVMNVLQRQKQTFEMQRNNLVDQATKEGSAMRVDPRKIKSMFGPVGQPTSAGGGQNFTPDVLAYAQKHQITPEQAEQIKTNRTGGK